MSQEDISCTTSGGNESHTLASIFIKLTAFDIRDWKNGELEKIAWELKTVLHQTDPYFSPDIIIENMVENISPYIGVDTQGEIEVSYP